MIKANFSVTEGNFFDFMTSPEKRIDKIYKKLVHSNSLSEETRRHLKTVGTRPGTMYGSCKVHRYVLMTFRPILSALQIPA